MMYFVAGFIAFLTPVITASAIVRERAHEASESTRGYIRDEPIKSVLVAAAAGAALATVLTVMARSRAARQG